MDGTVRMWDLHKGEEKFVLRGHMQAVRGVAFSPDGKRLASASEDGRVRLWDTGTGEEKLIIKNLVNENPPFSPVYSVAFHPDGKLLATGSRVGFCEEIHSRDAGIRFWDTETGKLVRTVPASEEDVFNHAIPHLAFSPDGERLVHDTDPASLTGRWVLRDVASGKDIRTVHAHQTATTSLVFTTDGKRIISAGADKTVRVWNATSGQLLFTLKAHQSPVTGVALGRGGSLLATSSSDGTIKIWNTGYRPTNLVYGAASNWNLSSEPRVNNKVTESNSRRILNGMTIQEVESILGPDDGYEASFVRWDQIWCGGSHWIGELAHGEMYVIGVPREATWKVWRSRNSEWYSWGSRDNPEAQALGVHRYRDSKYSWIAVAFIDDRVVKCVHTFDRDYTTQRQFAVAAAVNLCLAVFLGMLWFRRKALARLKSLL
jgi:WD40 repeat protein